MHENLMHLSKYLLIGIYEVDNKGSNAECKYKHHLERKRKDQFN